MAVLVGSVVFDTIKTGANPQGTALYRVNVVTGIKMRLTELESRLPSDSSLPYYAHVSPDGKRLLVFKGSAYQVVELDGSRSRQWQDKKGTGVADSYSRVCTFWLEDSRHIVHFLSSGAESVPCLLMRSVDAPAETQHVPLPATPEFQARDYFSPPRITPGGMVFAFASAYEENDTRTLLLIPPVSPRQNQNHAPRATRHDVCNGPGTAWDGSRHVPEWNPRGVALQSATPCVSPARMVAPLAARFEVHSHLPDAAVYFPPRRQPGA